MTKTTKKQAAPKANASADAATLSDAEKAAAIKEGAKDAAREAGKEIAEANEGSLASDAEPRRQFTGYDEIQQYAGMLGLGIDAFVAAIAEDAPAPIPEEKVYGLLALERNGQNRTDYVKAAIKRLGLTKDDPLPGGGPGYTNDIHPVSDLYS